MRLLLTSDGLTSVKIREEVLKLLDKPAKDNLVLIMYTTKSKKYKKYLSKIKKQLVSLGIKPKNIYYANISRNISAKKFKDFDVLFSCGGNTFYILGRVRKTGFDKFIKNFVKSGKLYIGVSAGSIIIHKTIEIAGWSKEGDINEIKLKNLRGLNMIRIAIFPHFHKSLAKEISSFKKKVNYPVIELRNKHAVLISGKKIKKI